MLVATALAQTRQTGNSTRTFGNLPLISAKAAQALHMPGPYNWGGAFLTPSFSNAKGDSIAQLSIEESQEEEEDDSMDEVSQSFR